MSYYIFNNVIKNESYLFIESVSNEIDKLLKKIITNKLSSDEMKLIKTIYKGLDLSPNKYTQLFNYSIKNFTILDIKKLMYVLLDIPYESIHLWFINLKMSDEIKNGINSRNNYDETPFSKKLFEEFPNVLGYRYQNEYGIKYYDPTLETVISKNPSDTYIDLHSTILGNYNNIKNSIIYFIDFRDLDKDDYDIKNINEIFYPNLKSLTNPPENKKDYSIIFKEFNKNLEMFNKLEYEKINANYDILQENVVYSDIIIYSNINLNLELNLEKLYNILELDDTCIFMKYNDFVKNDFYKLNTNAIYKTILKGDNNNNLDDYKQYLVNYEHNKYEPIISKKQLIEWKNNVYFEKENKYKKKNETLSLKIDLSEIKEKLICTLIINYNGTIEIKLLIPEYEKKNFEKYELSYDDLILMKNKMNTILKKFKKIEPNINLINDNYQFININCNSNFIIEYDKKITLAVLKKNIEKFFCFGYVIENDENKITIKFRNTNTYTNYNNIKDYYLNLKKVEIRSFIKLWDTESKKKFNLSSIESDELRLLFDEDTSKNVLDDVDIIIESGEETNEFHITINNANNMNEINKIYSILETIIYNVTKKKTTPIKTKKTKVLKSRNFKRSRISKKKLVTIDSESESDSESDNDSNNDYDTDSDSGDNSNSNSLDISDLDTVMPTKMRNYMTNMRKRDGKLLSWTKTDEYPPYTTKCGAQNMRQPLIINNRELDNMNKKNPIGYNEIKNNIIPWGSSSKKINNYLCPRIWCIKCKISITPKQLIDTLKKSGAKSEKIDYTKKACPSKDCPGKIIKNKNNIKYGETVLIRKSDTDNYWGDTNIIDKLIKDDTNTNDIKNTFKQVHQFINDIKGDEQEEYLAYWKNYLKGTEKTGYVSFLDSKSHPEGKCMPCCNSTQSMDNHDIDYTKNINQCFFQNVNYILENINDDNKLKHNEQIEYENIYVYEGEEKKKVDPIILKKKDIILLVNSKINNFYIITEDKPTILSKFGNLKIPFINGLVITNNYTKKKYIVTKDKLGNFDNLSEIYNQSNNKLRASLIYIREWSKKKKLDEDKFGILPDKLDKLFNIDINKYISKGYLNIPYTDHNNCFILRKGNTNNSKYSLFNVMSSIFDISKEQYIINLLDYLTPTIYISLNAGEIFKYFYDDTKIINKTNFSKWMELYKDNIAKLMLDTKNKSNIQFLEDVFISMENYKKYICDLNIYKDINLLIDLISRENSELNISGFNIIVIEYDNDKIKLINPLNNDINNIFSHNRDNLVLLKNKSHFEILYEFDIDKDENIVYNGYSFYNESNYNKVEKLKYLLINESTKENISYYEIKVHINIKIKNIIIDKYFKCIGILTTDNTIIFTMDFNFNEDYPHIYLKNIPKLNLDEAIKKYTELYTLLNKEFKLKLKIHTIVKSNTNIYCLINTNDNYIPINDTYKTTKNYSPFKVIDEDGLLDIDDILFSNVFKDDIQQLFNNNYELKKNIYNNLKYELSNFFNTKDIKILELKDDIISIINNKVIPVNDKRIYILNIVKFLIDNLSTFGIPKLYNDTKTCNNNSTNCKDIDKCKIVGKEEVKIVEFDGKKYKLPFSECKLILNKDNYESYYRILSEEILMFFHKRNQIFSGNYKIKKKNNVNNHILILNGLDYDDKIINLYDKNKFLYANSYFYKIYNNQQIGESTNFNDILYQKTINNIYGSNIDWNNNKWNNDLIKAGNCIKTYKIRSDSNIYNGCNYHNSLSKKFNIDETNGKMCATSINTSSAHKGYAKTFGFCPKPLNWTKPSKKITPVKTHKPQKTHKRIKEYKVVNSLFPIPPAPTGWTGPHKKKFLAGPLKIDGKGVKKETFKEAIEEANKHEQCFGITLTPSGYTLRLGKTEGLQDSPKGETSWKKKDADKKSKKVKFNPHRTFPSTPKGFNGPYENTYLSVNYKLNGRMVKKDTFKEAFDEATKYEKCRGITLKNNKFILRTSNELKKSDSGEISWIKSGSIKKKINSKKSIKAKKNWKKAINLVKKSSKLKKIDNWINNYFDDANYKIIETATNGDCFFDSIKRSGGKDILEQRRLLLKYLTQELFDRDYGLYISIKKDLDKEKRDYIKATKGTDQKIIKKHYDEIKKIEQNDILSEFKYFDKINTLDKYKEYVLNPSFWANTWAISIIEKELNIKVIILSEQAFYRKDYANILQCGDMIGQDLNQNLPTCKICGMTTSDREYLDIYNTGGGGADVSKKIKILKNALTKHDVEVTSDDTLETLVEKYKNDMPDNHKFEEKIIVNPEFKPKKYVIVTYSGNHYRLVSYNGQHSFNKLDKLPPKILELIKRNCYNTGLYKSIKGIGIK